MVLMVTVANLNQCIYLITTQMDCQRYVKVNSKFTVRKESMYCDFYGVDQHQESSSKSLVSILKVTVLTDQTESDRGE